jgi:hypothetical protein
MSCPLQSQSSALFPVFLCPPHGPFPNPFPLNGFRTLCANRPAKIARNPFSSIDFRTLVKTIGDGVGISNRNSASLLHSSLTLFPISPLPATLTETTRGGGTPGTRISKFSSSPLRFPPPYSLASCISERYPCNVCAMQGQVGCPVLPLLAQANVVSQGLQVQTLKPDWRFFHGYCYHRNGTGCQNLRHQTSHQ